MRNHTTLQALVGLVAAAVLAGCGGDGDDDVVGSDAATFPEVLAQLNTPAGLTSPRVAEVFADNYRDSGLTKPQVLDALGQDAAALTADPANYSLFPQASLDDTALADCDAQGICTLTGTLHNKDAEDTAVPFSVKVVRTGAEQYRLLGDQAAS